MNHKQESKIQQKPEDQAAKKQIRRRILDARDRLTPEERRRGAVLLEERICGHQWFYSSGMLLAFASFGSEIDTDGLIGEALRQGKKVYLPRVEGEELHFYRVWDLSELKGGYRGIPEPAGTSEEYCYREAEASGTLMVMPGVAFDGQRNRLGYGKGFYDRFLADKEALRLRTIAVGFACQLVEALPARAWDVRPCQVICV